MLWTNKFNCRLKHTSLDSATATQLLDSLLTTSNIPPLSATSLKLRSTLRQAARLQRRTLQESSALRSLRLMVVARVSRDNASQAQQADSENRRKLNHSCEVTKKMRMEVN